jgi:hypothetical protein
MRTFIFQLSSLPFTAYIWVFFLVFVIHELEEWNIDRFEHRNFIDFLPSATDRSARLWIGLIVFIGFILCLIASLLGNSSGAWIILPAISIMILNALQHLYWLFYFRQYVPGLITAICLLIPLGCFIIIFAIIQEIIPAWYALIWTIIIILGFIQTIRAGNKMTPLIRTVNEIGIWLSNLIENRSTQ